ESVVLVVNEGHRCIGIITEADLVIGDEQGDLHIPHYIELFGGVVFLEPLRRFENKLKKAFASRARDLMTDDPTTADVDASARAVLEGGASWLAVAAAEEARVLRAAGIDARLLVMGALDDEELAVALAADADVVAWTEEFLAALPAQARVHVKLDTGMGRLGT